ncbi:MAG: site-specific integrase [Colwellia sp.]|nr:site-specific integrase [Colwellia sp.]
MKINNNNPAQVWLCSCNSMVSIKNYTVILNLLARNLGGNCLISYPWHDLDYVKVIELKRQLIDRKLRYTSINTYLTVIKAVSREAWRLGQMPIDRHMKIQDVKRLRGFTETSGRALTVKEINKLLNYSNLSEVTKVHRDSAIIAVCYGAGLRRSEVVKLDLSDFIDDKIFVHGKGNVNKHLFLPKFAIKAINKWLTYRGDFKGALFPRFIIGGTMTDFRMLPNAVNCILERRRKAAKIAPFTPHDLRRSYATNLIDNGVDLFTVQGLMRHTDIETTRRYDLRGDKTKKAAVAMLPI